MGTASQAGEITGGTGTDLIAGTEEQLKMERKLSLKVEFLRNDRFVRLIAGGVLGAVMLYYCLQIVMFLIPIIYPGYNTVKTLQTDSVRQRRRWLCYWLIYTSLTIMEELLFMLVWLLPFYPLARTTL